MKNIKYLLAISFAVGLILPSFTSATTTTLEELQNLITQLQQQVQQLLLAQTLTTTLSIGKCGDGICGPIEKANPNLCPQDCQQTATIASSTAATCPKYSSPAPNWCNNGKIISGITDKNGCQGPPQCIIPPTPSSAPRYGMASDKIKNLQEALASIPNIYPKGIISGWFGPLTKEAIQKFQCQYNIVCSGDEKTTGYGLVGPKTATKLQEVSSAQSSKIVPGKQLPQYVISIHNEPYYSFPNHNQLMEIGYANLKEIINKANSYNIKLTLMFTAQWADYISESSERLKELESWKKQGHEIAGHHHGIYHGNWDGYTNYSKEFAESERIKQGKSEKYLGTLKDYINKLKKINPDIKSGCMNESEDVNEMPDEIIYATCSGYGNFGEPGRTASDFKDSGKAKNEYISVGEWKGISRKWLTHFYIGNSENLQSAKDIFNSMSKDQIFSVVTHSDNADASYLFAFFDFIHSKDQGYPRGATSRTLSQAIEENLLPEKTITIVQKTIQAPASATTTISSTCPLIAKPSPLLENQCKNKGGKMQPVYNQFNCIVKYQCVSSITSGITCERCSIIYSYTYANKWPAGPDGICDTADDDKSAVQYSCDSSCPARSQNYGSCTATAATCPKYSLPAPNWCNNGKIISGITDKNGCQGPLQCIIIPPP